MHAIRLRHPWHRAWHAQAASLALYQRSFNRPSGLLPEQAVWLVVEPLPPPTSPGDATPGGCRLVAIDSLKLNAARPRLVAADGTLRAQIAAELQAFNRLEIVCELTNQPDSPPELAELMQVRLEIDST